MRRSNLLIAIIFSTLGIFLGVFFCNYSYFEFEKEINPIDLVSLVLSTSVGLWVAIVLSKATNKETSEKQLFITEVKSLVPVLERIYSGVEEKKLPFKDTVREFKTLNESLLLIKKLLAISHCRKVDIELSRNELINLRRSVTRISPINDYIILSQTQYLAIKPFVEKLKLELFKLIFEINKA